MNQDYDRDKEFPLFPYLSEEGKEQAQKLTDEFKKQLIKVAEVALGELYCDVLVNIESDSWTNYRNKMMAGFRNYNNRHEQGAYDFKAIREEIYKEFREEIIKDLNQDLVKENEDLKRQVEQEREFNRRRNKY